MFIGNFELTNLFKGLYDNFFDKIELGITDNLSFINNAFNYVINLLNYLGNIIIWLSSYSGLSVEVVSIIFSLIAGGFGIIIATYGIKLIVKWWSMLVP